MPLSKLKKMSTTSKWIVSLNAADELRAKDKKPLNYKQKHPSFHEVIGPILTGFYWIFQDKELNKK